MIDVKKRENKVFRSIRPENPSGNLIQEEETFQTEQRPDNILSLLFRLLSLVLTRTQL